MPMNVVYQGPDDLADVIPVFPLPGALLLPRGTARARAGIVPRWARICGAGGGRKSGWVIALRISPSFRWPPGFQEWPGAIRSFLTLAL